MRGKNLLHKSIVLFHRISCSNMSGKGRAAKTQKKSSSQPESKTREIDCDNMQLLLDIPSGKVFDDQIEPGVAYLNAEDMAFLGILPQTRILISTREEGTPVLTALVWPDKRTATGCIRMQGIMLFADAAPSQEASEAGTPTGSVQSKKKPVSASGSVKRKGDKSENATPEGTPVRIKKISTLDDFAPATQVLVSRVDIPSSATARINTMALRKLLLGAVLPLGELVTFPGLPNARTEVVSEDRPAPLSIVAKSSHAHGDAEYAFVSAETVFLEEAQSFPSFAPSSVDPSRAPDALSFSLQDQPQHQAQVTPKADASLPSFGGYYSEFQSVLELATSALTNPELYTRYNLKPPRGVLLAGPPGTGKTLLARAVAAKLGVPLTVVRGPELLSGVVGESEARLRSVFERAARTGVVPGAADGSGVILPPCGILLLDEVDGLAPARDKAGEVEARMVAQLLTLMDGLHAPETGSPESAAHDSKGAANAASVATLAQASILSVSELADSSHKPQSTAQLLRKVSSATASAPSPRLFVLGTTNNASAVDPALRRPGRFDREVYIGVPTAAQRLSILDACLVKYPNNLTAADKAQLVERLHGYVGADIAALCRESALSCLKRAMRGEKKEGDSVKAQLVVTVEDFKEGLKHVQPSALREIAVEVPKTYWSDIGGQDEVKKRLLEAVEWPLKFPHLFTEMGIRPPKGILLYGPPGCSKTLLARAMATECRMNFISIKGPELFSMYVGDSEKAVAEAFARARATAPTILFFDEFDALAQRRSDSEGSGTSVGTRVISQLLVEMDGLSALKSVVVIAATNRPDIIDPALLRPGRIDTQLYIGLPDFPARVAIACNELKKIPPEGVDSDPNQPRIQSSDAAAIEAMMASVHANSPASCSVCFTPYVHPVSIAALTEGCTGAEVVAFVRDAALCAVREKVRSDHHSKNSTPTDETTCVCGSLVQSPSVESKSARLELRHFLQAHRALTKQVTQDMLEFYERFKNKYGK